MKPSILGAACAATLGVASGAAQAVSISGQGTWESTLQGRDLDGNLATFEAYYDTSLNITWLANANYAQTSGYDADGLMNWFAANAWAASLNPFGSGITGWRLPTTVDVGNNGATYTNAYQGVDYGYNITTHSEMSHMFYVTLGNTAYYDTSGVPTGCTGTCLTNTGSFSDLQSDGYWSATEFHAPPTSLAWIFYTSIGLQGSEDKYYSYYAWAVHAGDVGASGVPVPAAAWLFGSGLLGLAGVSRKRRR